MFKILLNRRFFNIKKCRYLNIRKLSTATKIHPNILVSESSDVIIPDVTIPEFILPKFEKYAKYTAIECASTGKSYTFGQVRTKCKNLNKALRHIFGLKKGEVVAVSLPNLPEYAVSIFSVFEAGLILTTINPIYTSEEVARQLLDSSTKVLITQSESVPLAKTAIKLIKKNIPIIAIKARQSDSLPQGVIDFEELVNTNIDIPDADYGKSGDLAFLPYSSGTTGLPKGVEITHNNVISSLSQLNHEDYNDYEPPTDIRQDVTAAVLPFYHIYGFVILSFNLYMGSKSVTLQKFSPDLYISVLKNHPVSMIYAAPPLVLFLTSHPAVKSEYFSHLKLLMSGAAPLGFSDEERIANKIANKKARVRQGYGLTESSALITYFPKSKERSEKNGGSVGKPVSNTMIKIVSPNDPTGTPLGPNESGEVLAKGPQMMKGYYKREEETKNAFLDGWFKTGDIGYYNEEEMMFITDRIKELIKVKGYQVAPAELEEVIRDHPSVEDTAVIGIPHPKYGEVPRAYIVQKKNSPLNIEELKKHVAQKVAPYKKLEGGVKIIESIPKNPSGKILRRQLKLGFEEKGI